MPSTASGSRRSTSQARRRRTVAVIVVCAVLAALGFAAVRVIQGRQDSPDTATEKIVPPSPTAVGSPGNCGAADLDLEVSVPQTTYQVGTPVNIAVTMRRTGARPCLVDGSAQGRPVVISSGSDRIWSSGDCGAPERMLLMGKGDVDRATIRWGGTRSSSGCPAGGAEAGAGTYTIVASIKGVAGAQSKPVTITLVPKGGATGSPSASPAATTTAPAATTTAPAAATPAATTPK